MKMPKQTMEAARTDGKVGPKFVDAAKGGSLAMGLAHHEKNVDVKGAQPSEKAQRMSRDASRI